jgi:hypothetical protein
MSSFSPTFTTLLVVEIALGSMGNVLVEIEGSCEPREIPRENVSEAHDDVDSSCDGRRETKEPRDETSHECGLVAVAGDRGRNADAE